MTETNSHRWRFFRAGGFDQARIDRGADLLRLDELDQKLWVALSCPVRGLEFDRRTLELIDTDADGHVRAPELIAAAKWAGALLKDPETLATGAAGLPLDAIDTGSDEGRTLASSAREILKNLGKPEATVITAEDTGDSERIFAATRFNGDGVVTAESAEAADDPDAARLIVEILDCHGGPTDRSGQPGVDRDGVDRFFAEVRAFADWARRPASDPALRPLGGGSDEDAAAALAAVHDKIDDYFVRCRLAAFDERAAAAMNGSEETFLAIAGGNLAGAGEGVAGLPLARVDAGRPLPLGDGVNPAWADAIAAFRDRVATPLFGAGEVLTAAQWQAVRERFAALAAWQAGKPETAVEKLGADRLAEIADGDGDRRLAALIDRDLALAGEADAIAAVDRLVRYCRDLLPLANNFVAFRDFYTRQNKAVFQAGTLYLDGRSCELVVPVLDAARHATLAGLSGVYLVYCDCIRGGDKMTIAAALTAGDSDQLMAGRNGVFYDRQGRDWDATIVRIVEHPISIRQAFWSPYKKASRLAAEQFQKLAAGKAKAADDALAAHVTAVPAKAEAGKLGGAAPAPFDVAKFAGIFAAIGLAVGALGTALAAIVTGLLGLKWWQMPLAIAGIMLVVSGPAMALAWFKLRNRNLGPLLDANGWAINTRARINIAFGTSLTQLAKLPDGAERGNADPYADKPLPWGWIVAGVVFAGLLIFVINVWFTIGPFTTRVMPLR